MVVLKGPFYTHTLSSPRGVDFKQKTSAEMGALGMSVPSARYDNYLFVLLTHRVCLSSCES